MTLDDVAMGLLWFVALYPVVTAAFWIAGALVFRIFDEATEVEDRQPEDWPPITVLVPAYNEAPVIGVSVTAALAVDYPDFEVVVLDDGSTDGTAEAAEQAGDRDPRLRVVRDDVNRGKAERLNIGFREAHELVIVCDADTQMHPLAPKLLVARMQRSQLNAAVGAGPHVINRTNLLCGMQILEAASILGMIRRTSALRGRVGIVAGVLGLFRRDAVQAVGGYRTEMSTEDIHLTWRLLMAGWHTAYEPNALIGMEVPARLSALWAQRCRWARGQGEVLHEHLGSVLRFRARGMWPTVVESMASLVWVISWAVALAIALIDLFVSSLDTLFGLAIAWGIAVAIVCLLQTTIALMLGNRYDRTASRALLLGPIYPLFFWSISAFAALRAEVPALIRGTASSRVAWDIPRDRAESA